MRRIFEPFIWAATAIGRLIDRGIYWLYNVHDRKYRENIRKYEEHDHD